MAGTALALWLVVAAAGEPAPGVDDLLADPLPSPAARVAPGARAAALAPLAVDTAEVLAASPEHVGAALLYAAEQAGARQDSAARTRFLRGWASLGALPAAPPSLASAAEDALRWAAGAGSFRLFATRHGDRVRIGLADPAALSIRIEATARTEDRAMTMARAEAEAPGRIEHVVDPALGAAARIEVRAWCDALQPPLLLRRIVLGAAEDGPEAPDPASLRGVPERLRAAPTAPAEAAAPAWPWWWFAAAAVAAGLAGAAVYQESQD